MANKQDLADARSCDDIAKALAVEKFSQPHVVPIFELIVLMCVFMICLNGSTIGRHLLIHTRPRRHLVFLVVQCCTYIIG